MLAYQRHYHALRNNADPHISKIRDSAHDVWVNRNGRSAIRPTIIAALAIFGAIMVFLAESTGSAAIMPRHLSLSKPKEAYVLFLPTSEGRWYVRSALTLIYALKTEPVFRDNRGRDVVVITTDLTSAEDTSRLVDAGALIRRVPYHIDSQFFNMSSVEPRYQHNLNKLWLWDMQEYDRVLYLDADVVLFRPLKDIWNDPNAWPKSGLAATTDFGVKKDGTIFSSGFMMVRPSRSVFESLKHVETDSLQRADQNVLNAYFSRNGYRPWVKLDSLYHRIHASAKDITDGAYMIHEKAWRPEADPMIRAAWYDWYGEMLGWRFARENERDERAKWQEAMASYRSAAAAAASASAVGASSLAER